MARHRHIALGSSKTTTTATARQHTGGAALLTIIVNAAPLLATILCRWFGRLAMPMGEALSAVAGAMTAVMSDGKRSTRDEGIKRSTAKSAAGAIGDLGRGGCVAEEKGRWVAVHEMREWRRGEGAVCCFRGIWLANLPDDDPDHWEASGLRERELLAGWLAGLSCTEHLSNSTIQRTRSKLSGSGPPFPLSPVAQSSQDQGPAKTAKRGQARARHRRSWEKGFAGRPQQSQQTSPRGRQAAPLKSSLASQKSPRFFGGEQRRYSDLESWTQVHLRIPAASQHWRIRQWTTADHEDGFQVLQLTGDRVLPGQPALQPRRHPPVLARWQQGHCLQSRRVRIAFILASSPRAGL